MSPCQDNARDAAYRLGWDHSAARLPTVRDATRVRYLANIPAGVCDDDALLDIYNRGRSDEIDARRRDL